MKFRRTRWHRWWAWHPIKVEDGTWVWLELVERRFDDTATAWSIAPNSGVVFYTKGYVYRWISE